MKLMINKEKFEQLKENKNMDKKYTVLLVDDEPANIEALRRLLEDEYNVIKAKDGLEALAILRNDPNPSRIGLIISDQRMPGMMGVEFLKQTISIIPNTIRIILTGFTDITDIIASINEGHIYKFLTKPIEPNDLSITVKRALEAYELEVQNIDLIEQLKQANENLEKKVKERTYHILQSIENLKKQKEELEYLNDFNNKLVAGLHHLSDTDPLTGLANRRSLKKFMETEWKRAIREKDEMSLIMMDIDNFKMYNDCYGHVMGDKCLMETAKIIQQELKRPPDFAARYGGEEFCCVLPKTNLEGAIIVVKNILAALRIAAIPHKGSTVSPYVTLSFGIHTMLPSSGVSWLELLEGADKYLYQAKNSGKKGIFCSEGIV